MVKKFDDTLSMDTSRILHLIEDALSNESLEKGLRTRLESGRNVIRRAKTRRASQVAPKIPILSDETLRCVSEPVSTTATPKVSDAPARPRFKKLEVIWKKPCRDSVSVFGTFSEPPWIEEFRMIRDPADGYYKVDLSDRGLSPGTYVFKFVVDGEWRIDPSLPTRQDLNGHVNNTMFVRSTLRPLKTVRSAPTVERAGISTPSSQGGGAFYPSSSVRFGLPFSRANTPMLQETTVIHRRPSAPVLEDSRCTTNLALLCGAWMIPHPEKVSTGGADSFFFCENAAGIADGVGEWEWRFKLDPRKFAEQLMRGCLTTVSKNECSDSLSSSPEDHAVNLLAEGYEYASAFGSSTACVMVMDDAGEKIGIANLGDSGCLHYRKQFLTNAMSMTCVMKTRDQQHAFNMPYQLSRLPKPEHYDELSNDPIYSELITTLKSLSGRQLNKIDKPTDCDVYSSSVMEGDLIILATDGVLDNLWSYDILSIVGETGSVSPFEARINSTCVPTDPEQIAKAIAIAAYEKSIMESGYKSPFGVECRKKTGSAHLGGKQDDISVVACWVTRREDLPSDHQKDTRLVCRDWWRTRGGMVRNNVIDDARRRSKYEQFMSNEL